MRWHEHLSLWLYRLAVRAVQPLLRRKLARRARAEPGYAMDVPARFGYVGMGPAPAGRPADAQAQDGLVAPGGGGGAKPECAGGPAGHTSSVGGDRGGIPGRGGRSTPGLATEHRWLWVHAVSLGETRAAAVLLAALRPALPGWRLLLTHSTATGREAGLALLRPGDAQTWLPWDTPASVNRFLAHWRPAAGLLMETEVWPELAQACQAAGVPLMLVNARLSAASARAMGRLAWLSRPAHRALAGVWAQSEADAQRLRALGAPVKAVVGNLKFDAQPDAGLCATGRAWRQRFGRPVALLASSREGEEAALLAELAAAKGGTGSTGGTGRAGAEAIAAQALGPALAQAGGGAPLQWLIVPRHPQRFDAVAALAEAAGWRVLRRSQWGASGPGVEIAPKAPPPPAAPEAAKAQAKTAQPTPDADRPTLWLGDSLGEMALYYSLADVALLGGSFGEYGGQNLIESAACGCPLLLGLHTYNFAEAADGALQAGAALAVADMTAAVQAALHWCGPGSEDRTQAAQAALAFSQAHRGAAQRTVQGLLTALGVEAPQG